MDGEHLQWCDWIQHLPLDGIRRAILDFGLRPRDGRHLYRFNGPIGSDLLLCGPSRGWKRHGKFELGGSTGHDSLVS